MQVETRELQNHLLSMVKQFHEICVENNLVYYIVGGTLLGAVRHHGFIPWDDDIDVAMPREDYNLLKSISNQIFPEYLEIKFYENTPNSPIHFVKLVDNRTTLIENGYRDYYEGVYIDIFPIDGAPNKASKIKKQQILARIYTSLILNHCYTDGRQGLRKAYGFFAKLLNMDKLHYSLEKTITQFPYESSEVVGNYLGAYGIREFIPKKCFGTPKTYKFEDTELYGPEDYHYYLTSIYGDYMQLPPVDKRVNTHQYYYVSLNKSYKEYQNELNK